MKEKKSKERKKGVVAQGGVGLGVGGGGGGGGGGGVTPYSGLKGEALPERVASLKLAVYKG